MPSNETSYPVLIVGAGPAGLVTAIALAHQGITPVVVERHESTSIYPRATGISTRSMEILRSWGLEDDLRSVGVDVRATMAVATTLVDPDHHLVPIGFGWDPVPDAEGGSVSPTRYLVAAQDEVEPFLVRHLRELGGKVFFGTELTGLQQDNEGVRVELSRVGSAESQVVHARYVVGADGARGSIASRLGVSQHGPGVLGDWESILFYADLGLTVAARRSAMHRVEHPDAAGLFLTTSTDHRWLYARPVIPGAEPTEASMLAGIRIAAGRPHLQPRIVGRQRFQFAASWTDRMRHGDVFLVGDAAHRMTPMGGMGLNTAIHDGHNLGWKLGWVLQGWADPALLDTYQQERHAIGINNSVRSTVIGPRPDDAISVDLGYVYRSAAIIADPNDPVVLGDDGQFSPAAQAGARAPHTRIYVDDQPASILDLFDGRLTLLTGKDGDRWRAAVHRLRLRDAAAPFAVLSCGTEFDDFEATFHEAYGISPSGAVLVRPDGHVAWRAVTASENLERDLITALDAALGRAPARR